MRDGPRLRGASQRTSVQVTWVLGLQLSQLGQRAPVCVESIGAFQRQRAYRPFPSSSHSSPSRSVHQCAQMRKVVASGDQRALVAREHGFGGL